MTHQDILHGNNLDLLAAVRDNFAHAVVTDPPYGLGFMGKDWDAALPDPRTWSECLRVLRPGGHLVAFGAPRLVHRLTCQIEDAGFEVRDQLLWVFGCLSEDTEILVNGEWVHYRKAMAGSLAMCYDIDDDTFSEQPIEKLFVYDYDDTAYRIQSDGTDQIVSRTHKCIVQRGGRWVFDTAESVAREQQARVPVLEDVRGLLSGLSMREQNAGGAEQEVRGLRDEETQRAAQKEADERTLGHDTDSVPRVQRRSVEACGVGVARGRSNVLIPMQRETAGGGAGQALAQGARGVDCGEPADLHGEDDRREQPGLEGRGHVQEEQGELHRPEVRKVPRRVSADGADGRLCDGAPPSPCDGDRPLPDAHRSGAPREPRQPGQPTREPCPVREQPGPQVVRASRFTTANLASVEPFHLSGKVWCVKVPTGAFVARRNGKIFVTGNSGFPKSLDVSKAIDAAAGAVREVVGRYQPPNGKPWNLANDVSEPGYSGGYDLRSASLNITAPATPEAAAWSGWGTALKPAYEPIVLARKPLDGTVAQTVQQWGTGAINVDGCRVEGDGAEAGRSRHGGGTMEGASFQMPDSRSSMPAGRWPANLILDEAAGAMLDAQSGYGDSGGASRFFKNSGFDAEELIIHRAKAILHGWNPDLASTADDSSTLPRAFVDSALNDVATWAALGVTLSVEWTGPTTNVTPNESRRIVETAITTILSIAQGCSLDWLLGKRFQNISHVNHVERCEQTGTMRITASRWKSNGSAEPVTFSITPMNSGLGEVASGARTYYCPKASRGEREAGLGHLPPRTVDPSRAEDAAARDNPRTGAGRSGEARRNHHATVKPVDLMRWLVRLVTPPGGIVLEPFAGSGTTPAACALEDVDCLAMELDADYVEIARARVAHAVQQREEEARERAEASRQLDMWGAA